MTVYIFVPSSFFELVGISSFSSVAAATKGLAAKEMLIRLVEIKVLNIAFGVFIGTRSSGVR